MTLASHISILRILLIIPIIFLTYFQTTLYTYLAFALFILAGITDYLDGYVARVTETETSLGALLDLLADKLLISVTLIWLIFLTPTVWFVIPSLMIISRELAISSIRQFIIEKKSETELKVSFIAKSKTTIQIISIAMMIIAPEFGKFFFQLCIAAIWISGIFSLISLFDYFSRWKQEYLN